MSPDVSAVEADLATDIPYRLGVPFLNLIFKRLAEWPGYLRQVWLRSRDIVSTPEFAAAAEQLGRDADWPPMRSPLLPGLGETDLRRARLLTASYAGVQPKLALLTAGWAAGLLKPPVDLTAAVTAPAVPSGVIDPDVDVPMVELPPHDPRVAQLFEEMVTLRHHPGVASYYRSLAQWPALLEVCWRPLSHEVTSAAYRARAGRLAETATIMATDLGLVDAGAVDAGRAGNKIVSLLDAWRDVQVPQLLLDTRYIAALLGEGPAA
jgi:hypothetical protein